MRGGFYEPSYIFFKDFPIRKPDLSKKEDQVVHDNLVKLADSIIELHKQKAEAKVPGVIEQIETQITYTDTKINQLVYQLYDLTEEEIKIIEQ